MEIKYPILIVPFIVIFFVVVFIKFKKNKSNDKKVANTYFIKNTGLYKSIINRYKFLIYGLFGLLFLCVVGTALLTSRFVSTSTHTNEIYDRDIVLCLDVSGSMTELDEEIIKAYGDIVDNMQGERFGIVLFDNTSFTLLPLTNDYDYIKDIIKKTTDAFKGYREEFDIDSVRYLYEGTREGEGSSIIGDGLATCVLGFPKLDKERSRIIILGTDNQVAGNQIITVPEAGELAKKYKVSVYTLDPYGYGKESKELEDLAKKTGGKYYNIKNSSNTKSIVGEIEKTEKSLRETTPISTVVDHPQIPVIIIIISLLGIFVVEKVIRR